jgi:hypothetical protein
MQLNTLSEQEISQFLEELLETNANIQLDDFEANSDALKNNLIEIYENKHYQDLKSLQTEFRIRTFVSIYYEKFDRRVVDYCTSISKENVNVLSSCLSEFQALKMPLFGYLFRGSQVAALNTKVQQLATFSSQINLKTDVQRIQDLLSQARAIISWVEEFGEPHVNFKTAYSLLIKKQNQSNIKTFSTSARSLGIRIYKYKL